MTAGASIRNVGGQSPWADAAATDLDVGQRWLGVEFRHFAALAAVAREGSFRRAAQSLGYVQSSISAQIAHLERVVGTQLVERSSGAAGTRLTVSGQLLLRHVEEILARFEAARMDIHALADGSSPTVRIGVVDGIGAQRLPGILNAFSARFPDARVDIRESNRDDQYFALLADGELDLVITELPLPDGPFEYKLLERDPYVLVVANDSPLARRVRSLDARQLAGLKLLLPPPSRNDELLLTRLSQSGIHQHPWLRPQSVAALQAIAGAGLGVAVMPALAVDHDDPSTTMIEAPGLLPERMIVLVSHRERAYATHLEEFMSLVDYGFAPPGSAATNGTD
jgi:molybdate transport repressor ModE-like protein